MSENGVDGFRPHEAFTGAGGQAGIEIWRIEEFEPVKQDPSTYGTFHTGDAYIVLHTTGRPGTGVMSWHIHFWLGRECTKDESGAAAMYTVELDDSLGGAPVQHREVQGHESKLFLSYFKRGIKYLAGGVKSGFKHVDNSQYERRLFHCKGKHTVRVQQVEVSFASLNLGDVFILDDGPNIYTWIGPRSSRMERIKGTEIARRIRDEEKAGRAHIHIIEKDWDTNQPFFEALGRKKGGVIKSGDDMDDADVVRQIEQSIVLYRIQDMGGGKQGSFPVADKPLFQSHLTSDSCFVLDSGFSGIFVWTGKKCSMQFKKKVWKTVHDFIDVRGYPEWITVTRVLDGGETPLFKQYFSDWHDDNETVAPHPDNREEQTGNNVAQQNYDSVDGSELHKKPMKVADHMPDDGEGSVEVWRVEDFELVPVAKKHYRLFFGGDSYVILYTYLLHGREAHIIYFWQGLKSTLDERGASAIHAMQLDDKFGGEPVQVRVVMNKEPAHFLKIFGGKLVIFMGGHLSGFHNVHNRDAYDPRDPVMFHIRGDKPDQTRAIQVECRAANLNSNDVFVIDSPDRTYIWIGKNADEREKEMAEYMMQFVAPGKSDINVLQEGTETLRFWNTIGGKEKYYTEPRKEDSQRIPPRLFHCSNASGKFRVEEVSDFTQEDLDEDDVMILDTYDEIFIWIGKGSNDFERKESMKTANNYLTSDPTGRSPENTVMTVVKQGFEPLPFTGQFPTWDYELWNSGRTFEELISEIGKENAGIQLYDEVKDIYTDAQKYTYRELRQKNLPEGVDAKKKEFYLTDEDFADIFGMSREDFDCKPVWKQTLLKKDVGLF